MDYITWSDEYSVGVESFDAEHKKIVEYINELHEGIQGGLIYLEIKKIIEGLADYTFYHFRNEENLMRKYSFPGIGEHTKEHHDLVIRVKTFREKNEAKDPDITLELLTFLRGWLLHHILNTDMKYKRFFIEKLA